MYCPKKKNIESGIVLVPAWFITNDGNKKSFHIQTVLSIATVIDIGFKSGNIIYFNCPSWHCSVPDGAYNEFVCVDGLQRLTAICRFANNEIKVFGSYFNEYTDLAMLNSHTIKLNVNDLKTERAVLQWYIDMNVGGTPHTTEEIERVKQMIKKL